MLGDVPLVTQNMLEWLTECEREVAPAFQRVTEIAKINQKKVLEAFWAERVSALDMVGSTGYGLDDEGRDKLERMYARVFGAERALVRPQIISGTHALRLGLFGVCRPGDEIIFATGEPYDTLLGVIGHRKTVGSLAEWNVKSTIVPLSGDGTIDIPAVVNAISSRTKLVMFQRSRGYSLRPSIHLSILKEAFQEIRDVHPNVLIGVDNCYGEFVEPIEPTNIGADLAMGSLIKNPGAGIAPTGGYVVGTEHVIEQVAAQLTAPGVGAEAGPTHDLLRSFYQALFLAPHVVSQAVKGSILASYVFEKLGFPVHPKWQEPRTDLIVSTEFGSKGRLLTFCHAVQQSAPIDSYVVPEAGHMAGYEDDVVMAAGSFVQGGSLDLSADGPMRPPYIGYFQGGLTYEHAFFAILKIAERLNQMNECQET
jgi:cystathionine beta-lyase family protein involved in aluminum resistance